MLSLALAAAGLGLVIFSAERLVKGVVGTSLGFGVSAFVVSVVFIGFDPENLAVGATGSYEEEAGIALGSVVGAAMVAIALAFGITALIAPMKFERAPAQILGVPLLAVLLNWFLGLDGELSRTDGGILLAVFTISVGYIAFLSRRGHDIRAGGEVAETMEEMEEEPRGRWSYLGLMALSLAAIILGSELLVEGSKDLIEVLGISGTVYGMTILALLVSIEELARELPAARAGHSEISFGNVVGSVLAFFLMNAGIIALVRPVGVADVAQEFYFPVCLATLAFLSLLMLGRSVPRWGGGALVAFYTVFIIGGYFW